MSDTLPCQKIGVAVKIGAGVVGLIMGYQLGSEAVEYAKTIAQPGVLEHMVNQHPTLTKGLTSVAFGGLGIAAGKLSEVAVAFGGLVYELYIRDYIRD